MTAFYFGSITYPSRDPLLRWDSFRPPSRTFQCARTASNGILVAAGTGRTTQTGSSSSTIAKELKSSAERIRGLNMGIGMVVGIVELLQLWSRCVRTIPRGRNIGSIYTTHQLIVHGGQTWDAVFIACVRRTYMYGFAYYGLVAHPYYSFISMHALRCESSHFFCPTRRDGQCKPLYFQHQQNNNSVMIPTLHPSIK